MAINGSLDDYSPAGALRVLSSDGKTGAVRFSGDAGCTVYLHHGQLYFARDESTDQALATALVRPDRLTAAAWALAIEQAGELPRVGELLVANGAIDPDLLASVALSVVYDPLIRLFREGDGAFEFEADTVHWIGPFRTFNVDAIVEEVRRRVREVDEMSPLIPSIDSWVTARPSLPDNAAQVTLLREDWELITVLSGSRTITELARDMGRGRYSAARVVHRLAAAGLVDVVPEALPAGPVVADAAPQQAIVAEAAPEVISEAPAWSTAEDLPEVEPPAADPPADDQPAADLPNLDQPANDFGSIEELRDLEGMLGGDWSTDELSELSHLDGETTEPGWDSASGESEPWSSGFDLDTGNGDSDGGLEGEWGLPQRQPVAVSDEPRDTLSSLLDRTGALDPDTNGAPTVTENGIPGLAGISGFRSAVGEESIADATSDTVREDLHPNAVWLESLYAEYMAEPEVETKKRKKETLDIAFGSDEQDDTNKVGTLRRLMDALKKL